MKTFFTSLVLIAISFTGYAQGGFDPDFGNNGVVSTNVLFGGSIDRVKAMELQPDGKIVVVGSTDSELSNQKLVIARYLTNGDLDLAFGSGGLVIEDLFPDGNVSGDDLILLPDGKLLVAGTANKAASYAKLFIRRYLSNGEPDLSFGNNGIAEKGFSFPIFVASIAVQSDGKIIAASNQEASEAWVFRYSADGAPDETWGTSPFFVYAENDMEIYDLAIQPDDKVLLAGTTRFNVPKHAKIVRLFSNGAYEGTSELSLSGSTYNEIALQDDGKIVAVGVAPGLGDPDFLLVRIDDQGIPDADFGQLGNGIVTTVVGLEVDRAESVVITPTGQILVAGFIDAPLPGDVSKIGVVLYNSDGTRSSCFGQNGILIMDLPGMTDLCYSVRLQPDGKMVLAGQHDNVIGTDFALIRYIPDFLSSSVSVIAGTTVQGQPSNTIYLGYGPQELELVANASGGDGNYSYDWSTGSSNETINVSPTTSTTYNLTVTDGTGCSSISSVTINVVDVRCGKNNDKVLVCHVTKGKASLSCMSPKQVEAHLNHGDQLGTCNISPARKFGQSLPSQNELKVEDVPIEKPLQPFGFKIYPNPTSSAFTIQLDHNFNNQKISLHVYDITGRLVEEKQNLIPGSTLSLGSNYSPGIYLVSIYHGNEVSNQRVFKRGN